MLSTKTGRERLGAWQIGEDAEFEGNRLWLN